MNSINRSLGISPSQCILLAGIPTSMDEYTKFSRGEIKSDFLTNCCFGRMKFYNEICAPLHKIVPEITKRGCEVILHATETDVRQAFKEFIVVIIFTHWRDNLIELNGRLINNEEFCTYIPPDFRGIIDVCACQPEDGLIVAMKQRVPNCSIRCSLIRVTADLQLEIVNLSIKLIYKFKIGYLDATGLILQQIFKKYNKIQRSKNGN